MKNISYYTLDSFEFCKSVLNSKRKRDGDKDYKDRLASLQKDIEDLYVEYEKKFSTNSLENIKKHTFTEQQKIDLLDLYSYKNKALQGLKTILTTDGNNRVRSTCQNCTLNEISSFDHILPKEEFPEFIVNPLNLFPSCTSCNSRKSSTWLHGGKRVFLNLYKDVLPNSQYLFVDVNFVGSNIEVDFYLSNTNSIDNDLFDLIENHYKRLKLLSRFRENSNDVIVTLQNIIYPNLGKLSVVELRETYNETLLSNKQYYGENYWKVVLEEKLIRNDNFFL